MSETFYCQRCNNRLRLHESLLSLNTVQVNLLRDKGNPQLNHYTRHSQVLDDADDLDPTQFISSEKLQFYNKLSPNKTVPVIERNESASHDKLTSVSTSLTSNSFVMLSENSDNEHNEDDELSSNHHEEDHADGPISSRLRLLAKVFELLSTSTEVDHPLCQECSALVIENYKHKFDQNQKEKEYYLSFLKKLRDQGELVEGADIDPKLAQAIEEYSKLEAQESTKIAELQQLEHTKTKLDEQLRQLQKEFDALQSGELNEILATRNGLSLELNASTARLGQAKAQYQHHLDHLDRLRKLNIYSQFFDISCDASNQFGTINGFRLGYRVPWSEINTALGQVMLLMVFLVKRLKLHLRGYKLVPMGSQSQIIKLVDEEDQTVRKSTLNLYSSNEFSLGKLFNFNKFDVSMIALLEVLEQIHQTLKKLDPELELPYSISHRRDTIGGKSIRVTSNSEWTDGCKFMLTNLSWILRYTSAHTSQ